MPHTFRLDHESYSRYEAAAMVYIEPPLSVADEWSAVRAALGSPHSGIDYRYDGRDAHESAVHFVNGRQGTNKDRIAEIQKIGERMVAWANDPSLFSKMSQETVFPHQD